MRILETPTLSTAEIMDDADITAAIELFFLTKKGVGSALIEVATQDGIVELTGSTDSLLARQRAEEIALAVRGVRGVINELVVCTADVPGTELYLNVGRALADDPATRDYNLRYTVAEGTVRLAGQVQSWAQKQLALRVVEGVRGVRHIEHDQLTTGSSHLPQSDQEITSQIQELLDWDIRLKNNLVQVRTTGRVVCLTGTVGSAAAKARIEAMAYAAGATRVDDRNLVVARWALEQGARADDAGPRTDDEIARAVRETFRRDPRLVAFEPLVQAHDGVVTLVGLASNLRARHAAEQDARHVVGVAEVHNLVKVRSDRFWPDTDVRQRVANALQRDPYVSRYDLSVNVLSGKAYLYGRVNNHFEQEQAADVAAGVNGVVEVESRITVPGEGAWAAASLDNRPTALNEPPANPDHDLAERIRTRYFWSALLHNQPIEVQVENGRATLTGVVDTWLERRQAAREARELGAREVNNHLHTRAALRL
jgi:osmotically-inducible protein OsmY